MPTISEACTVKHGVVRVEGLVLRVGGEIAWRQWERPRDTVTLTLKLDTKAVQELLAQATSANQ